MYRLCACWAANRRVLIVSRRKRQTFRPAQQPDYDSPAFNQRRLGQSGASDIEIHARELLKIKEKLNRLMAKHCGRDCNLADLEPPTPTVIISCPPKG